MSCGDGRDVEEDGQGCWAQCAVSVSLEVPPLGAFCQLVPPLPPLPPPPPLPPLSPLPLTVAFAAAALADVAAAAPCPRIVGTDGSSGTPCLRPPTPVSPGV